MSFLYAFLILLVVYPFIGTILFSLVEPLKISTIMKVSIITYGRPLLGAVVVWTVCVPFNKEIAELTALLVAGTMLRIPFSERKYFSSLTKEAGIVTIEYFSELLQRKKIILTRSEITGFEQSTSSRFLDKPSGLTVSIPQEVLEFTVLNRIKVSL